MKAGNVDPTLFNVRDEEADYVLRMMFLDRRGPW